MTRPLHYLSFLIFLATLLTANSSPAGFSGIGFWRLQAPSLFISTTPQSVVVGVCSAVTTVRTKNLSGVITNVSSNLTVNLATSGALVFYSDVNCTNAITSVVVTTGTSTATFYFIKNTTGTETVTLSATAYTQVNQTETGTTNSFVWTGGGGDANWATVANWSGGAAPGSTNVAIFNNTCASNCSPTIAANINIAGIRIETGYTGTITQSGGSTITIGSSGWTQSAGTFVGSSAGDAITLNGPYALTAGSYSATTGTLSVNSHWNISGSPSFNANNGLWQLNGNCSNYTISPGTVNYNNVTVAGSCATYNLSGGTMSILGTLNFNSSSNPAFTNGTLMAYGNVNVLAGTFSGSAILQLGGNIAGQTLTGVATASILNLTIAAGTNDVTLSGTIKTTYGNYSLVSVGTLTTTGSTLLFAGSCNSFTINPGSANYNDVTFNGNCFTYDLGAGSMNILGTLTLVTGNVANGTLNVYGNLASSGSGTSGSAQVQFLGTASTSVTTSGTNFPYGNATINRTGGGGITLAANATWNGASQSTTVTAGNINMAGFGLTLRSLSLNGNTLTKNAGVLTVNGSVAGTGALFGGTVDP